jgi:hypothetical protein
VVIGAFVAGSATPKAWVQVPLGVWTDTTAPVAAICFIAVWTLVVSALARVAGTGPSALGGKVAEATAAGLVTHAVVVEAVVVEAVVVEAGLVGVVVAAVVDAGVPVGVGVFAGWLDEPLEQAASVTDSATIVAIRLRRLMIRARRSTLGVSGVDWFGPCGKALSCVRRCAFEWHSRSLGRTV